MASTGQHAGSNNFKPAPSIVLGLLLALVFFSVLFYAFNAGGTSSSTHKAVVATTTHSVASTPAPSVSQSPAAAPKATSPSAAPSTKPTRPVAAPQIYVVKPGDNLTIIAQWFHRPLKTFYESNLSTVGGDWNLIYPGQKLKIIT